STIFNIGGVSFHRPRPASRLIHAEGYAASLMSPIHNLGLYLRQIFATVIIPDRADCFSACVYLLAGATQRMVLGRVGIHRPYSQRTDVRDDTIRKEQTRIAVLSKVYLEEMNLPVSLYDAMVRTPYVDKARK
ncbi:MAG: hypothetical protein M3461_06870, partial [Pseudomonadota bacterium]|nr:hypothetical protein [Pseudomonadota bacterium]